MSNSSDTTPMSDAEKWKNLPPAIRRVASGDDGPPSEYGLQVGVDDHPLRAFYREAQAEDEAEDLRNARRIDARHMRGAR